MPAVEPSRLLRQAVELAGILDRPDRLRSLLRDYLEAFAERVHRPKPVAGGRKSARVFGTSKTALNALEAAFKAQTAGSFESALSAAETLWEEGSGESRLLACSILSDHPAHGVRAWVEQKAQQCDDPVGLAELAQLALRSWARRHAEEFLQAAAGWLASESRRMRILSLSALGARVSDLLQDEVSSVIPLLRGQAANAGGEERRALILAVEGIAARSPGEGARFLLDELASEIGGADRLVVDTIDAFPEEHRRRLLAALSASSPAGIMPAHPRLDRHGR